VKSDREPIFWPALLGGLALFLFVLPVLDPGVQLLYRDTGRLYYEVKLYMAQRLLHGQLPLWDPWTEAGTSLLGQVTPGLFHPLTALYLFLPFDLAFKLNHLLTLPAAALGAYLLARRLGVSRLASFIPAAGYAGCGYLVSMAASNLPYAIGGATVPLALAAFLWFLERRSVLRFALAALVLGSCMLAGEPQSMLFAGLIGTAWALGRAAFSEGPLRARLRQLVLAGSLCLAWGLSALALSGPATVPAVARLRSSDRLQGISAQEQLMFANHPLRLAGLLIPFGFDDSPERFDEADQSVASQPFLEYFSANSGSFAESILLGPPLLLLALFAARRRRGAFLLLGALLFFLASTGTGLGSAPLLARVVPGIRFFRFAEKFAAPASLLVALAAGLGAGELLEGERRKALPLVCAATFLAATLSALFGVIGRWPQALLATMVDLGETHSEHVAQLFVASLRSGLLLAALLCLAVAAVAFLRLRDRLSARSALLLAALCCACTAYAATIQQLHTAPIEVVHDPPGLATELLARAGPSRDRWRLFVSNWREVPAMRRFGLRVAQTIGGREMLQPQFESLWKIDGINPYFSAPDLQYNRAVMAAPQPFFSLLRVRFAVHMPWEMSQKEASQYGFQHAKAGAWVHEFAQQPSSFLVAQVASEPDESAALARIAGPGFDPHTQAVVLAPLQALGPGRLRVARSSLVTLQPEALRLEVDSDQKALLIVPAHHDPGWRATVDGAPAAVERVDLTVLGVRLQPGHHRVVLTFWPVGLTAGVWVFAGLLALLALLAWWERQTLSAK